MLKNLEKFILKYFHLATAIAHNQIIRKEKKIEKDIGAREFSSRNEEKIEQIFDI